jgi:hypothetical protein
MRGKLPRFSHGGAVRLTAERVSLAERYTIDADEAEARAVRAREQETRVFDAREREARALEARAREEREREAREAEARAVSTREEKAREVAQAAAQLESRAVEGREPQQADQLRSAKLQPELPDEAHVIPDEDAAEVPEVELNEGPAEKDLPIYAWFNAQ